MICSNIFFLYFSFEIDQSRIFDQFYFSWRFNLGNSNLKAMINFKGQNSLTLISDVPKILTFSLHYGFLYIYIMPKIFKISIFTKWIKVIIIRVPKDFFFLYFRFDIDSIIFWSKSAKIKAVKWSFKVREKLCSVSTTDIDEQSSPWRRTCNWSFDQGQIRQVCHFKTLLIYWLPR